MCVIDGNMDCVINPITNGILQFFSPYINWILNLIYPILQFISNLIGLMYAILTFWSGLFLDIFSANPYATITFGLITTGITIVIFMRIWNIVADIQIFGWKLPKI